MKPDDRPLSADSTLTSRVPPPPIPPAAYRHAAPCGPWPWQNLDDTIPDSSTGIQHTHAPTDGPSKECESCHWRCYPENLFPNWMKGQVDRCNIKDMPSDGNISKIHHIKVAENGVFVDSGVEDVHHDNEELYDQLVKDPAEPCRVRVFCIDNLTVEVMQKLGTTYKIEPFFWTSSVNWIPARYQEDPRPGLGDHITITLKFPREAKLASLAAVALSDSKPDLKLGEVIDTRRPLFLRTKVGDNSSYNQNVLITDFLAIHMKRALGNSTIITYHHTPEWHSTRAEQLHTRIWLVGQSVYWKNIFRRSHDPTFLLLATLWYALYSWDEAFETLWEHISKLELQVIDKRDIGLTRELHKIRAHLLHYASLLEDFRESVIFVKKIRNPAMDSPEYRDEHNDSRKLLSEECTHLLNQIDRLRMSREMWDKRLDNAMHLVFSSVNIEDSQRMQALTRAAVRDSAAMKQISYLTMVFLPASFIAGVFGMNVQEINPGTGQTLAHYIVAALILTTISTWIIIACQPRWGTKRNGWLITDVGTRLSWPVLLLRRLGQPRQGDDENKGRFNV